MISSRQLRSQRRLRDQRRRRQGWRRHRDRPRRVLLVGCPLVVVGSGGGLPGGFGLPGCPAISGSVWCQGKRVPLSELRDLFPHRCDTGATTPGGLDAALADALNVRRKRRHGQLDGHSVQSELKILGRSQVVRHRILIPAYGGSNPPAPAKIFKSATGNLSFASRLHGLRKPKFHRWRLVAVSA